MQANPRTKFQAYLDNLGSNEDPVSNPASVKPQAKSVKTSRNGSIVKINRNTLHKSFFGDYISRQARLYREVYEEQLLAGGSRLHHSNVSVLYDSRPVANSGSCLKENNMVNFERQQSRGKLQRLHNKHSHSVNERRFLYMPKGGISD